MNHGSNSLPWVGDHAMEQGVDASMLVLCISVLALCYPTSWEMICWANAARGVCNFAKSTFPSAWNIRRPVIWLCWTSPVWQKVWCHRYIGTRSSLHHMTTFDLTISPDSFPGMLLLTPAHLIAITAWGPLANRSRTLRVSSTPGGAVHIIP